MREWVWVGMLWRRKKVDVMNEKEEEEEDSTVGEETRMKGTFAT